MTLSDDLTSDRVRQDFKQAMGSVAAAVAVVTTLVDDEPHGTTVSAFASLSMTPPMMLVSLDNGSNLLAGLHPGKILGVNVLSAHLDDVAMRFAGKLRGAQKFDGIDWEVRDGAPALLDRHAWVSLRISRLVEAGDHTIVLGDVVAAQSSASVPLTYWQRTFGTHRPFQGRS